MLYQSTDSNLRNILFKANIALPAQQNLCLNKFDHFLQLLLYHYVISLLYSKNPITQLHNICKIQS